MSVLLGLYLGCFPVPMHLSVLPAIFSVRICVADFMLRSLIHLDLNFVHGIRYGPIFILLLNEYPVMPAPFVKCDFYPFDIFCFFVKIRCSKVRGLTSRSSIQFH